MGHEAPDPEIVLRETRLRFVANFSEQCAQIVTLGADADPARHEEAVRLAHRMAGLAGMIGFVRVSAHAASVENDLRDTAHGADSIRRLVVGLQDIFAEELSASLPSSRPTDAAPTPLKLLLVEDDDVQRYIVAAYLQRAGHTVHEVDAGDRAVAAAHEAQPDVILLDLDLPGLDGHQVCRLLKADSALAAIPVVFLSAERDLSGRMAALALGADDFLLKPIDLPELLLRLQRLRQRLRPAEAAHLGEPLTYDRFQEVAPQALQSEPAAIALLRTPRDERARVMQLLRQETRRRDVIGEYDRNHVLLLLPEAGATAARNRLAAIIELIAQRGIPGLIAGIAASSTPGERTLDSLIEEADDALAAARYRGLTVGLRTEEPRGAVKASEDGAIILVGDDDPDVVRIVDAHLGAAGYRRILTFDGLKTLEQLHAQRPDALILDLMMPRMSGFDVLKKIRDEVDAPPKILVLSARGREDDVTRAFDLGADDYMAKPFNPHELLARVTRLLR